MVENLPRSVRVLSGALAVLAGLVAAAAAVSAAHDVTYWLADLPNVDDGKSPMPFGEIQVVDGTGAGGTFSVEDDTGILATVAVPPGGWSAFSMPERLDLTDITKDGVYRVTADANLVVTMANSPSPANMTMDTTRVLAESYLGTEHWDFSHTGTFSGRDYLTVVATENVTNVTVRLTEFSDSGGPVPMLPPGMDHTFTLQRFEALHLVTRDTLSFGYNEFTGSRITSDKPVAVFTGNECLMLWPQLACDHVEEQQPPIDYAGKEYIVCTSAGPARSGGYDRLRVLATQGGTTTVNVGATTFTLAGKGDWDEVDITADQHLTADQPVLVAQFMGKDKTDHPGDPSYVMLTPTDLYTPLGHSWYAPPDPMMAGTPFTNHVLVAAPTSSTVELDGAPMPAAAWSAVGSSGFSCGRVGVVPGVHEVAGLDPVSVLAYGHGQWASYWHSVDSRVLGPPHAHFDAFPACHHDPSLFVPLGVAEGWPIVAYQWDFGDGTVSPWYPWPPKNASYAYSAPGTYAVSLTVKDSRGLTDVATGDVTICNDPPTIASAGDRFIIAGTSDGFQVSASDPNKDPVAFSAVGPPGIVADASGWYHWATKDPDDIGVFTVVLVATDIWGASASTTMTITVVPPAGVPGAKQDSDLDGTPDDEDVCPQDHDPGQDDSDGDGIGDACMAKGGSAETAPYTPAQEEADRPRPQAKTSPAPLPSPETTLPPCLLPTPPVVQSVTAKRLPDGRVEVRWTADLPCPGGGFLVWNGTGADRVAWVAAEAGGYVAWDAEPWWAGHAYAVQGALVPQGAFDPVRAVLSAEVPVVDLPVCPDCAVDPGEAGPLAATAPPGAAADPAAIVAVVAVGGATALVLLAALVVTFVLVRRRRRAA